MIIIPHSNQIINSQSNFGSVIDSNSFLKMMISVIIFATVILKIQLTLGQISESTKCTSSSLTSCAYSQIRCPPNYFFNGQFCLPVQAATATPTQQPPTLSGPQCTPRSPITVAPTNPDPLPVKPVCDRFYEWNGQDCYQVLSNEPICPLGHNLTAAGQCVSVLRALCQENYHQNGDFCVGLLEAPVICPDNYYWDGTVCVYRIIPSCPDGLVLNNGYCEIFNAGACPSGTIMDNFKCIGHHQIEIQCDYGYSWNGNNCVNSTNSCEDGYDLNNYICEKYIIKSPDYECPPRTQMIDSECVSVEMICPKGFSLINSVCVEQITTTNNSAPFITPNCTTGYQLVGCECVKINETTQPPLIPICPPNYVYKDGLCYFERDHRPPVCPINYETINGICVPLRPDTSEKCPPGYKLISGVCVTEELPVPPTNCSDGHILIQGICVPLPKCPQIDCQTNFTSSCICPGGYTLSNGLCVLIDQGSKVCPSGYQLINGICILTTQPGSNSCPPGYRMSNGTCFQPVHPGFNVCPPGYKKINENCVPAESTDVNPCPTGYQWNNGTCVLTYPDSNVCSPGYQWVDGNCIPVESENPDFKPCPTGYQWSNGVCVDTENPGYEVCPQGYYWINGTCVNFTTVVPNPDENGLDPPNVPTIPIMPPTVQPCYPNNQNPPCKTCPPNNLPCQPCPSYNGSHQINPPSSVPPKSPPGCPDCPQVTHYITKDGHISITNIVNVAHHHQRPPKQNEIYATDNIDENIDYDTNDQNSTDEGEVTKKCCEIITPRQCKRNGDEWTCFHRKYQRCGDICTQPKIYLKPKMIHYQPPILIMPPPPRRIYGRRRMFNAGAVGKCYEKQLKIFSIIYQRTHWRVQIFKKNLFKLLYETSLSTRNFFRIF